MLGIEQDIALRVDEHLILQATLTLAPGARSMVVFAKGSEPQRKNALHRAVATDLCKQGIASLLLDTTMPTEAYVQQRAGRFAYDAHLHAERLALTALWIARAPQFADMALGFLGFGIGAASALLAAADLPNHVQSIVLYNGRVELAQSRMKDVVASTLVLNTPHSVDAQAFGGRLVQRQVQDIDDLCVVAGSWFRQSRLEEVPLRRAG